MSKLSKQQAKNHLIAENLVDSDQELSLEQREFILRNWTPLANHGSSVGKTGAFFTPLELASEMMIEVDQGAKRVVDLCAGIGALSFVHSDSNFHREFDGDYEYTCVEFNPDFVRVGKRVIPQANWITGSVFDRKLWGDFEIKKPFDIAISNPPYGLLRRADCPAWLKYHGKKELMVAEIAHKIARYGVFLIPQGSAPFILSGEKAEAEGGYKKTPNDHCDKLLAKAGVKLNPNCGIDTEFTMRENELQWQGTNQVTEIVIVQDKNDV